jgi:hypothetical protein
LFTYGDGWKGRAQNPAPAHNGLRRRFSDTRWLWRRPKADSVSASGIWRSGHFWRGPDLQTSNRQPERRLIESILQDRQPDGRQSDGGGVSG